MDTVAFFNSILPGAGHRASAVFHNGMKAAPGHTFYETNNDDLIADAGKHSGQGKNVFHACAVYKEPTNRKGNNTLAVKALWLDLDVGPNKPYPTQRDAALDVAKFTKAVGLPTPWIVNSGYGLHVYFAFTKALLPEQWQRLAAIFAQVLDHVGVKHDTSRTEDIASILRTPGTENYKRDEPALVKILKAGVEAPAAEVYAKLKQYCTDNNLIIGTALPTKGKPLKTNDLIGNQEYPPSKLENFQGRCAVLDEVDQTGGNVPYEIWWRAMGVAKHMVDADAVAAYWSRERAATGHDKADPQKGIASWNSGPTTCSEFAKHSTKCMSCPLNGKVRSPIQLGVDETPVVSEQVKSTPAQQLVVDGPRWGYKSQWVMEKMARDVKIAFANGLMCRNIRDEDGLVKQREFCNQYWQVTDRIRSSEGIWQLEITHDTYPGKPPAKFLFDCAGVLNPGAIREMFCKRELNITGGQLGMQSAQTALMWAQNEIRGLGQETLTLNCMGWRSENGTPRGEMTGEFVFGTDMFRAKKSRVPVQMSESVSPNLRYNLRAKGTLGGWVQMVDRIYNRPGAMPYQFIMCASFAAPLTRLLVDQGTWHGIPIALTGITGAAKSTTAMAAMTVYGPPSSLTFNASDEGDTFAALCNKVGTLQNLPFIADEMTSITPEKMSSIMFMLANGQAKDRCRVDGSLVPNPYRWDTISFCTGNDKFHEMLLQLQNQKTQEASQVRVFEIELSAHDLHTTFKDVSKSEVEQDLLGEQYGVVGQEWLQFIVNNVGLIRAKMQKKRREWQIDPNDTSAVRFYQDLLVVVETAAQLAKAKGYINFDLVAMMDWARSHLRKLRDGILQRDSTASTSDFIASLYGRTITTKKMKLGPGRRNENEIPLEALSTSRSPAARKAIDDKRFFFSASALAEWCKENRMQPSEMIRHMTEQKLLAGNQPKAQLVSLGGGTTVSRPRAPCWELDYNAVASMTNDPPALDADEVGSNVVPISAAVAEAAPAQPAGTGT